MNAIMVVSKEWTVPFFVMAGVYAFLFAIPAIWLAARRRNLDGFVRVWGPVAASLTAASGIAVIHDTWGTRLLLAGIVVPLVAVASYFGYLLYLQLKRALR
ncbi:MAG: hypothetical protein HY669_02195 [Chloroflexi bacterium]|nr:hypothetical protein [Chloroflexota bacterium]